MRLVDAAWHRDEDRRGDLAVAACAATALALVLLNAMVGQLLVSVLVVGVGVPVIVLLTRGIAWTTELVMVLGMFLAPMNDVRVGGPVTAADLLFALGFVLLAPTLLRRRLEISQLFVLSWLVIFVLSLLASVAAANSGISFNHLARFMIAALVLPLAFMTWRPRQQLLVLMAAAYLAGVAVSVSYAATLGAGGPRPFGLTTHPNFFGLTSVLGAALVPYVLQHFARRLRWAVWLAGLLCVYGVWISGSRAAFVALVAVVVVYTLREASVFMGLAMAAAGTTLILFLDRLGSSGNNAFGRILGGGSAAGSDYQREQAFEAAMDRIAAHPILGNGYEHAMEAHSIYLQVTTSIGVIGLAAYVLLLAAMALPLLDTHRPNYRLAYPALTYALVGIFTNSFWDRFVWAVLALSLAGVVLDNHLRGHHVHRHHESEPETDTEPELVPELTRPENA
ncbi:MAG TPA: hypothetical protein VFK52_08305 [Nocardioidaceae bacterium]|nr:hypothetical protein [Nocardioidaceae bacterium]